LMENSEEKCALKDCETRENSGGNFRQPIYKLQVREATVQIRIHKLCVLTLHTCLYERMKALESKSLCGQRHRCIPEIRRRK